jgi:hypothetical protein
MKNYHLQVTDLTDSKVYKMTIKAKSLPIAVDQALDFYCQELGCCDNDLNVQIVGSDFEN